MRNVLDSSTLLISSLILASASWIVAFAASIAASQSLTLFPKFTWWGLVFQLMVVIGVSTLVFIGQLEAYKPFALCCISIAFIYSSNSVNNFVYYSHSSTSAASAGFIIMSIINFLWLFYLGSDISNLDSPLNQKRSISLSKQHHHNHNHNQHQLQTQSTLNLAPNTEITGLENIELGSSHSVSVSSFNDNYPILVRGLYDYNASPDDANELSFKKGEMLRVENTIGNWWLGRNSKGDIGMCPSNYLEIVN